MRLIYVSFETFSKLSNFEIETKLLRSASKLMFRGHFRSLKVKNFLSKVKLHQI